MMYPILCKTQQAGAVRADRVLCLCQLDHCSLSYDLLILAPSIVCSVDVDVFGQLALSWVFLRIKSILREGLILVGLARCVAMVCIFKLFLSAILAGF